MSRRRRAANASRPTRVRHLVALDALNVMTRLRSRQDDMLKRFSRHRDRHALLEPLRSWFTTVEFGSLEALSPAEQKAVNAFYECLGELRWYLEFTEDMPTQVQIQLTHFMKGLEAAHVALGDAVGHVEDEGAAVVSATVVARKTTK